MGGGRNKVGEVRNHIAEYGNQLLRLFRFVNPETNGPLGDGTLKQTLSGATPHTTKCNKDSTEYRCCIVCIHGIVCFIRNTFVLILLENNAEALIELNIL